MKILKTTKVLCIALIISIIATVIAPVGAFTVSAAEYTSGDYTYVVSANGEVTITAYSGSGGDVVIPRTLGGYPVTVIGMNAFYNCDTLTSIDVSDVKVICTDAFYHCSALTQVNLENVTEIGEDAFYACTVLTGVDLPNIESLYDNPFGSCYDLKTITVSSDNPYYSVKDNVLYNKDQTTIICCPASKMYTFKAPSSVTAIGNEAFSICYALMDISLPNVTTIGNGAFYYCAYLSNISMPKVTDIGQSAFEKCSRLTSIELPAMLSISDSAFYGCNTLESISAPNATAIEFGAFDSCAALTDVYIPKVTNVGRWAFNNCTALTSIDLPSATTINGLAFGYCTALTTVNMPNVKTIAARAFAGSGLRTADLTKVTSIGRNAFDACENLTIYAPLYSYAHQYALDNGINYAETFVDEVKSVSHEFVDDKVIFTVTTGAAFYSSVKVTTGDDFYGSLGSTSTYVVNSDGDYVWTIEIDKPRKTTDYIFAVCYSGTKEYSYDAYYYPIVLEYSYEVLDGEAIIIGYDGEGGDITIPSTIDGYPVTAIGDNAFSWCFSITSVDTGNVTVIGKYAFSYSSLSEINMPNVTTIGESAFEYSDLASASMPKVTTIGAWAFCGCALTSIDLTNVTAVGDYAFYACPLTSVHIPKDTILGNNPFNRCAELTTITVDSENEYLASQDGILYNKDKTKLICYPAGKTDSSYTVPDSVTTIGDVAFAECVYLTNVSMPCVTTIEYTAFSYCTSLESVDMPEVVTVGSMVFYGCSSLASVSMPSVLSIGDNAFAYCADEFTIYAYSNTCAHQYATENGFNFVDMSAEVEPITYEIVDGKIVFTVITEAGDYSRLKLTTADNLRGSLVTANSYTINANGNYVWTIKFNAPTQTTNYAFDLRSAETGKYLKEYFYYEVEVIPTVKSVSHIVTDGKIVFTVTTKAGDFSRIKVTSPDKLGGSLGIATSYTVNADGDYVWTIKAAAPEGTTNYAFDLRSAETGKYLKEYFYYEAEIVPNVKSVSYEVVNGKIIFTVTTKADDFARIKVTTADNLSGSLGVASTYTVNADGDYVWTIKANAPTETTNYAFDLRLASTGKYLKDYCYFEYVYEVEEFIKSVSCEEIDDNLVFTVITKAGDYNRLRCGASTSTVDNIANTNTYTVNAEGDYVWTVKIAKPSESMDLYFDLRNSNTNKFIKEFYVFSYTA